MDPSNFQQQQRNNRITQQVLLQQQQQAMLIQQQQLHKQQLQQQQQQHQQQQMLYQQQPQHQQSVMQSSSYHPLSNNLKRPPLSDVIGPNHAFVRAKRFNPTDRTLPVFESPDQSTSQYPLEPILQDRQRNLFRIAKNYERLQKIEQEIDWTISRKRIELDDNLRKPNSVRRKLRVKVWNTVENQSWQIGTKDDENQDSTDSSVLPNFTNGQGIPKWTLHLQGHLLKPPITTSNPDSPIIIDEIRRPFSSLLRSLVVRLDRPDDLYAEPNIIEWNRPANSQTLNEFSTITITRSGSEDCLIQIALHLDHFPQRFKLDPVLGSFLDLKEASFETILEGIWIYVKKNRLMDGADKRFVRKDSNLACLFPPSTDRIPFHQLSENIRKYLSTPEPALISFQVRVDEESHENRAEYFDIEFDIEDPAKLHLMNIKSALDNGNHSISKEISNLDEQIADYVAKLREVKIRRDFYKSFTNDPVGFIERWLKSQGRDLEVLFGLDRGLEGSSVNPMQSIIKSSESLIGSESYRSSEFFKQPWVQDGVRLYEAREFHEKIGKLKALNQSNANGIGSINGATNLNHGVTHPVGMGNGHISANNPHLQHSLANTNVMNNSGVASNVTPGGSNANVRR
ncbi:hypothetical protein O181_015897 [Austropuccinia psidii MF-1]|uniref:DM2 domain-containing protein n=1 Tax=Austropuccinia psidii MF-1 TaxID=1389203 RepID=A0A9Q3C2Z1_9BASI|nr:hypothetical protein [Austropuccinia psidii MF-1]